MVSLAIEEEGFFADFTIPVIIVILLGVHLLVSGRINFFLIFIFSVLLVYLGFK